jgi:hypothetical protein
MTQKCVFKNENNTCLTSPANKINIKELKENFIKKYPDYPLAHVLVNEPDEMSVAEFIAKVGTWIKI